MRVTIVLLVAIFLSQAVFAQEGEAAPKKFAITGGIDLGSDVLPTGALDGDGNPTNEAWTRLGFQPDLAFGKFGVGIDLSFRFKMFPEPDKAVEFYPGDWVPDYNGNGKSFLDVYLPKIMYFRYGLKGVDPLFAKLGSINDLSLGNGFIVGSYSNMKFLPEQRIFGLDFGLDGQLFGFPYVGLELLTGNLARFDVLGGRVFARPFVGTQIPLLKNMQTGLTAAIDTKPDLYASTALAAKPKAAWGIDAMLPLMGGKLFPMAAFMDLAFDPNETMGAMVGVGGKLIAIFNYGAQIRLLQDGFIPVYFDGNYDIYRAAKHDFMENPANKGQDFMIGWYASLGTSLFEDKIIFNAALDGPFKAIPSTASDNQADYPHAKAVFIFGEGIIPGIYFDAGYEKYFLGLENGFFKDLVDPTNAIIGMAVNYETGGSLLTLKYNANWDPAAQKFDVSSSLSASMKF